MKSEENKTEIEVNKVRSYFDNWKIVIKKLDEGLDVTIREKHAARTEMINSKAKIQDLMKEVDLLIKLSENIEDEYTYDKDCSELHDIWCLLKQISDDLTAMEKELEGAAKDKVSSESDNNDNPSLEEDSESDVVDRKIKKASTKKKKKK